MTTEHTVARHVCRDGTEVQLSRDAIVRGRVRCPHCEITIGEDLLVWREKNPFRDA